MSDTPSLWDYFEKCDNDDKQAQCRICNKLYSYSSTTHNLKQHLINKHSNEVKTFPVNTRQGRSEPLLRCNRKIVWGYFSKVEGEDKLATCNICDKLLSYKTTITNLKTHLKRVHADAFDRLNENLPPDADEEFEEVYLEYDDDSNQSSPNPSINVWSYFERETGGRARCVVCRATLSNQQRELKYHLREKHPKLLGEVLQDSDNDSEINEEDDQNETTYTEVVYLDDSQNSRKSESKDIRTPRKVERSRSIQKRKEEMKRRDSSSSDEYLIKKKKVDKDDEELEKFGKYITCLLKKIPRDVCMKLQLDIVSLIMNTKLSTTQRSEIQTFSTKDPSLENKVVLDGVPVTIQTVGTVPGTGFMLTVPNTVDCTKKEIITNLNSSDVKVNSSQDVTSVSSSLSLPIQNAVTETVAVPVPNTFSSHGFSFTIGPSLNSEKSEEKPS